MVNKLLNQYFALFIYIFHCFNSLRLAWMKGGAQVGNVFCGASGPHRTIGGVMAI